MLRLIWTSRTRPASSMKMRSMTHAGLAESLRQARVFDLERLQVLDRGGREIARRRGRRRRGGAAGAAGAATATGAGSGRHGLGRRRRDERCRRRGGRGGDHARLGRDAVGARAASVGAGGGGRDLRRRLWSGQADEDRRHVGDGFADLTNLQQGPAPRPRAPPRSRRPWRVAATASAGRTRHRPGNGGGVKRCAPRRGRRRAARCDASVQSSAWERGRNDPHGSRTKRLRESSPKCESFSLALGNC